MKEQRNPLQKGALHKEPQNVKTSLFLTKTCITTVSHLSDIPAQSPGPGPMVRHFSDGNNSPERGFPGIKKTVKTSQNR